MNRLWDEIKEIPSSQTDLKKFGITLGLIFGVLGGLGCWHHKEPAAAWLLAAAFFMGFGCAAPGFLKPIQKSWMALALALGWFMSRVILCVLFYLVLTPIALILRLTGRDLLQAKWGEKRDTFWTNRDINDEKSSYEKQY